MNKTCFFMGIVGIGVGMLPFLALMGVLPTAPRSPNDAPDWIGILVGLAFLFAGIAVMMRSFAGTDAQGNLVSTAPRALQFVNNGLGLLIAAALAMIFTWIALGSGERHFTVSAGGISGPAGAGGEIPGRVMFGLGAILGWVIVGIAGLQMMRRRRSRDEDQNSGSSFVTGTRE
jgi:hypothetical protein